LKALKAKTGFPARKELHLQIARETLPYRLQTCQSPLSRANFLKQVNQSINHEREKGEIPLSLVGSASLEDPDQYLQ